MRSPELDGLNAAALEKIMLRLGSIERWLALHLGANIDDNDNHKNEDVKGFLVVKWVVSSSAAKL